MKVAYVPCVSQTPGTVWGPEAAWGEGQSVRGGRAPSKGAAGFVHELQIRKKHLAPNKSSVTWQISDGVSNLFKAIGFQFPENLFLTF